MIPCIVLRAAIALDIKAIYIIKSAGRPFVRYIINSMQSKSKV